MAAPTANPTPTTHNFFWISHGTFLRFGYQNWGSGEPNNYVGSENCLEYVNEFWNDVDCYSAFQNFICESLINRV